MSKQEISLFTCTVGPAIQGWWTKYIDLVGDLGDTDILHLEWLHLSDNVKRLEKAHEIYVDMSYKVATHGKNTICRNLAKQGAFDTAEKIAVTANRKYFGPVDETTFALLPRKSLEHSRFDPPGGPPLVWRNFQQQVAEFEDSIGVRWEPDGVTRRHVFEEEWGSSTTFPRSKEPGPRKINEREMGQHDIVTGGSGTRYNFNPKSNIKIQWIILSAFTRLEGSQRIPSHRKILRITLDSLS